VYVVQAGDNIYRISLQFGVSMSELMAVNGINAATMNSIYVGSSLIILRRPICPHPPRFGAGRRPGVHRDHGHADADRTGRTCRGGAAG